MSSNTRLAEASIDKASEAINNRRLDLPWGDRQAWALKDNIQKYIVDIPQLENENGIITYAMWRALTRDVLELAGYDIRFLRQKYEQVLKEEGGDVNVKAPAVLALLDNFEFKSNGGVAGSIEGLAGIADGTTVQTSPLAHVRLTVPRGYVLTEDGSSAYELGVPLSQEVYSLDIAKMNINVNDVAKTFASGVEGTSRVASNIAVSVGDKETTNMLVNLGATTAILLGGATAFNMMAHHLTVNVFWV